MDVYMYMYMYVLTLFTLNKPHYQLFDGVSKLWVGVQTLLKALVMVFLRALADVGNGREGREGDIVLIIETRLIVTLLASCTTQTSLYMYNMYMYIYTCFIKVHVQCRPWTN